jgi:hypothetical protein
MASAHLTDRDRAQLDEQGIPPEEIERQLELFRDPPPPTHLERPCTVGDGIMTLPAERHDELLALQERAAAAGRLGRMVPASGAASRMFKTLSAQLEAGAEMTREELDRRADEGDEPARDTLRLAAEIERFAFCDEVLRMAASERDYRRLLEHLLTSDGLDYAEQPKGLILFHRYPDRPRTAFEEQLVEAASVVRDRGDRCAVHFTVAPAHRAGFERLLEQLRPVLRERLGASFDVSFSVQSPSTDTIAVDPELRPFRREDGSLLLRPGGHGALIGNLGTLEHEIVQLKNIDNVVPDHLKPDVVRWKRLLVGVFVEVQTRIFALLERLEQEQPTPELMSESRRLLLEDFGLDAGGGAAAMGDLADQAGQLRERLERPLRVCGVVRNEGEPGGGPFWVRDAQGLVSAQIVEASQVDADAPGQQEILRSATHFNPVDLVCGVRDRHGRAYDLDRFVDPRTVFISRKSHAGRPLLALERPGLWNGAMAHWNTLFVEVPVETFAPVKTVFDLLRPQHQPAD